MKEDKSSPKHKHEQAEYSVLLHDHNLDGEPVVDKQTTCRSDRKRVSLFVSKDEAVVLSVMRLLVLNTSKTGVARALTKDTPLDFFAFSAMPHFSSITVHAGPMRSA